MERIIIYLLLASMVLSIGVTAEPSQQFNKIFLDPFYRASMTGAQPYTYTVNVAPPDGISKVASAIVNFQLWLNPTVTFEVTVNGQACNTPRYTVHTTYAGAGEGSIFFDCSNIIKAPGTYTVVLTPSSTTGAITGWLDISYMNAPKGDLEVHGTEYLPGHRAKVWVQLLNASGADVNSGACQVNIYTPDNEEFITNGPMTSLGVNGVYYYDLTAPQADGVYPAIAECYYDVSSITESIDNFTLNTGTVASGTYLLTSNLDGDEHKIQQLNGALNFEYALHDMCGRNISELFLTGVNVVVNSRWVDSVTGDNIVIHWFNYTSGAWVALPNQIIDPNDRVTVSNFIETKNVTRAGIVNSAGKMRLKFNDTLPTLGTNKQIEMDYVAVSCEQLSSPNWQEVKGSSELHITSEHGWVIESAAFSGKVTNETYLDEFVYNFTILSQTSRDEEDVEVHTTMPMPFPCHHVKNLTVDGVDTTWYGRNNHDDAATNGCEVYWYMDLAKSANYPVSITAENWYKVELDTWGTEVDLLYGVVNLICNNYVLSNSLENFTIPLEDRAYQATGDAFYDVCAQFYSLFYEFNKTYNEEYLFNQADFTSAQMDRLDENWRHISAVHTDLANLGKSISIGLELGASYSAALMANPTGQPVPDYATYWANTSTTYLNFLRTYSIPAEVWAYPTRTLTSNFSEELWSYNGTVSSSLLTQFAYSNWNYVGRYTHGIIV